MATALRIALMSLVTRDPGLHKSKTKTKTKRKKPFKTPPMAANGGPPNSKYVPVLVKQVTPASTICYLHLPAPGSECMTHDSKGPPIKKNR
jgi:hypothetical protein